MEWGLLLTLSWNSLIEGIFTREIIYIVAQGCQFLPSPGKECPKFISVYVYYRHAQLTRISTELVDALNLYHQLMHEGQAMQHHAGYGMGN